MDPLSVVAAAAGLGDVAFRLASTLYTFIRDVKQTDATVSELASEVHTLGSTRVAVHTQLREIVRQYENDQTSGTTKLWFLTQSELDHYHRTIDKLAKIVDNVRLKPGNVAEQAFRLVKLNMSKSDVVETRSLIRSHTTTLQISLQIINITISHLAPKQADQALLTKLDSLQQSVDLLLKQKDDVRSSIHIPNDNALLQQANDVLSSGASLYESSVAGGSIISESILKLQHKRREHIPDWIQNVQALQLKDDIPSTSSMPPHKSEPPSEQNFGNDDTRPMPEGYFASGKSYQDTRQSSAYSSSTQVTSLEVDLTPHRSSVQSEAIQQLSSPGFVSESSSKSSHPDVSAHFWLPHPADEAEDAAEWDVEFEIGVAKQSLQLAGGTLSNENYQAAYELLQTAVEMIEEISPTHRDFYNQHLLNFNLALCIFHLRSPEESETALTGFLERPNVITKEDSLLLCDAGHLLSQVYVKLGKLDLALSTCHGSARGRWKLLGDKEHKYFDSLTLLVRIYELQNNSKRAKVYASMLPISSRSHYLERYAKLEPNPVEISNLDERHEPADEEYRHQRERSPAVVSIRPILPTSPRIQSEITSQMTTTTTLDCDAQDGESVNPPSSDGDGDPRMHAEKPPTDYPVVQNNRSISSQASSMDLSSGKTQTSMASIMRSLKNATIGYSKAQLIVLDVTSNHPYIPPESKLDELASLMSRPSDVEEVMEVIEERLGDTAKNVLRVLRSMVVLMHLLCKGPEACVLWAVKKIDLIKSIRQFANVDEDKRNIGRHVREYATEVVLFIQDNTRLREARKRGSADFWF